MGTYLYLDLYLYILTHTHIYYIYINVYTHTHTIQHNHSCFSLLGRGGNVPLHGPALCRLGQLVRARHLVAGRHLVRALHLLLDTHVCIFIDLFTDGLYTEGTRAHTQRELIRKWLWESNGGFLAYI